MMRYRVITLEALDCVQRLKDSIRNMWRTLVSASMTSDPQT